MPKDYISPPLPLRSNHTPQGNAGARDRAPEFPHSESAIEFERNYFLALGWPQDLIARLETDARTARVGLIETAIASGALSAARSMAAYRAPRPYTGERTGDGRT
jgi:hypothetical protein